MKREKSKSEAELRSELVNKWSKREEENEEYYQEQITIQRKQVEDYYLKKMEMFETALTRKTSVQLDELRAEKENELEKLREQLVNSKLDVKKSCDEIESLSKQVEDLKHKLKAQVVGFWNLI